MKSQLTVVGLGGSLAEHSSSLAALKIALEGAANWFERQLVMSKKTETALSGIGVRGLGKRSRWPPFETYQ
jgi:hypothetical protein